MCYPCKRSVRISYQASQRVQMQKREYRFIFGPVPSAFTIGSNVSVSREVREKQAIDQFMWIHGFDHTLLVSG